MGSSLTIIDCKNCGGFGCIDNEYKEGIRITDCEDCDYRLEETYDIFTQEVYTKKKLVVEALNTNDNLIHPNGLNKRSTTQN